jgi:two-component system sensor histidine kinase QseC
MMLSLRTMLLGSILASTILAWGLAALVTYRDLQKEINQLFDAHLAESARSLLQQARREHHGWRRERDDDEHEREEDDDDDDEDKRIPALQHRGKLLERRLVFQIWDESGRLILKSRQDMPDTPLIPLDQEGYGRADWKGQEVRVFSSWNRHRSLHVQVAESMQSRLDLVQATLRHALTPVLIMIIPLIIAIILAVNYALRILRRLAQELMQRTPEDLNPLEEKGLPRELQPFTQALNGLFVRLHRALENERRFTADAAHELRTPLAAVKVQAQVALRSQEENARQRALEGVVKGIDRATHLVEQLLTMARLDPDTELPSEAIPLVPLLVNVVSSLAPEAVAKGIELTLEEGPEPIIRGQKAMLEILVRNLVDNAIRYTPASGVVSIRLVKGEGSCELIVADNGPGLSEEQKKHLPGRFSRLSRPSGDGSGLGLSIVQRIASIHKARLLLETGLQGRGLQVRVIFLNHSPPIQ